MQQHQRRSLPAKLEGQANSARSLKAEITGVFSSLGRHIDIYTYVDSLSSLGKRNLSSTNEFHITLHLNESGSFWPVDFATIFQCPSFGQNATTDYGPVGKVGVLNKVGFRFDFRSANAKRRRRSAVVKRVNDMRLRGGRETSWDGLLELDEHVVDWV